MQTIKKLIAEQILVGVKEINSAAELTAEEIAADKVRYAGRFSVVSYDAPVYYLMLTTDTAHLPTFAVDCEGYIYINGDNVGGNRYRISSGRLYALLAELHYTAQE